MRRLLPLFFLFLFTGVLVGQEYQDWKWLHQKPHGNANRWVKMWDADNWYVIGASGTFMKTTDGGTTWWWHQKGGYPRVDGSTGLLYDAHFFNKDTGIVVGTGGVMRTTNGGVTFDTVQVNVNNTATAYQVYFLNNNIGYVAGTSGIRIARTSDGGLTWTPNTVLTSATYYDVWSPNDTIIVASTSAGNVRRSTDQGLTWTTISTGASATLYRMEFVDALKGWVAGSAGSARYTTDAGLTWTSANTGLPSVSFYDIDYVNVSPTLFQDFEGTDFPPAGWQRVNVLGTKQWVRDNYYAFDGSYSAYIDYETLGGEDWLITPKITPLAGDQLTFYLRRQYTTPYPPDSLIIWVSTTDSALSSFTNKLIAIDVANLPTGWNQYILTNISSYIGQPIFIAFQHKNTDGNGAWLDAVKVGPDIPVQEVWLTGDPQYLWKSANNGTSWQSVSFLSPLQPWTSTYYAADFYGDKLAAVGAYGLINSKTASNNPVCYTNFLKAGTIYDVWADGQNIITVGAPSLAGSTFDQIMISTDAGNNWGFGTFASKTTENTGTKEVLPVENEESDNKEVMTVTSNSTFRSIYMFNNTTGWILGSNGAIYKTTNTGLTWDSVVTTIPATAVLYKADFISPTTGWVVNNTADDLGTVWKTTDGGTSWTQQSIGATGSTTRLYGMDMVNENYGWVINYTPKPYKTTDGGATWTAQSLSDGFGVYLYDIQMFDTLNGYCCGASGRFYKTTDGGANWNVMATPVGTSPSFYDLDFFDMNTGYIVGSVGTTLFTTDGGTTWQVSNTSGYSTNYGACTVMTNTDTARIFAVGSGANIWKKDIYVVPVELAAFTYSLNGSDVTLHWTTATETNNRGFEIERSSADKKWESIGFIIGKGTTTEKSSYQFTDKGLSDGIYNYRIKQTDYNGSFKYYNLSESVEISIPLEFSLSQNYPNPFNPATTINFSIPKAVDVQLKVYDILGNEVATLINAAKEPGRYQVNFDGSKLSSGVYLYQLKAGDFKEVKKLILMK